MADHSSQLNVIAFDTAADARLCLLTVAQLAEEDALTLLDAVFVSRRDDGKVRVHQTSDLTPLEGAVEGGIWGAILGTILLGPLGGLAAGALTAGVGGLLGRFIDAGIDNHFIEQIQQQVQPGRTALALLTRAGDEAALETALGKFAGATLLYSDLPPAVHVEVGRALAEGTVDHQADLTTAAPTD